MFSHPWSDTENENENEMKNQGGKNIENCFVKVGKLNKILSERTAEHLQNSKKTEIGSCNYNLTLINRCFPINSSVVKMKLEPTFNNEKCTVSWHADSTLEHYSSIAVYHCTREKKTKMSEKIALANTKAIKMEKKRKSEEKKTANKIIEKNLEKIEEPGTVIPTITLEKNEIIRTCTLTSNKDKDVTTESKVKIERNIIKKDSDHVDDSWRISLRVCPNAEGPKAGKLKIGEIKYVLLLVLHRDDHNYFLNINDYINYISYSQFIYCCRIEILIHLFIPQNIVSVNFTCLLCFLIFRTTSHYTIL